MKKLLLTFVFLLVSTSVYAADLFYIKATGGNNSNTGLSLDQAWATFAYAQSQMTPGDTLFLATGNYTHAENGMMIITISGVDGSPILFKSITDGGAVIDAGGSTRYPFQMRGTSGTNHKSYVTVEGVIFKNRSIAPLVDGKWVNHVTFKKCLAIDPAAASTNAIWNFNVSNNILLEDCAAAGPARKQFMFLSTHDSKMRRCVALFKTELTSGGEGGVAFNVYGGNNCIVENCIHLPDQGASQTCDWPFLVNGNNATSNGSNNRVLGCYTIGGEKGLGVSAQDGSALVGDNEYKDCVSLSPLNTGANNAFGGDLKDQHDVTFNKNTFVLTEDWDTSYALAVSVQTASPLDGWIGGTLKNNSLLSSIGKIGLYIPSSAKIGTVNHTYNNLYGFTTAYSGTTAGTGEIAVNPVYDTATYGNGAYLMVPTALQGVGEGGGNIGAEILYQYVDGTLTTTPLWPLPMDALILTETGISPTYAANGGIWTTISGIYDVTPPTAPAMSTPTPSSTLSGATETFTWTANTTGVTNWWLYFGVEVGGKTIYDSGALGTLLTKEVTGLPTDGSTIYVRLWYRVGVAPWEFIDYTYTAAGGGAPPEFEMEFLATRDTYIISDDQTANKGAFQFTGLRFDGTRELRDLTLFDFSSLTAGYTITKAEIHKYVYTETGSSYIGRDASIKRLTRTDWVEGNNTAGTGADWLEWAADGGGSWSTAGGDYTETYGTTTAMVGGVGTWHIYDVTEMAQWCGTNTSELLSVINLFPATGNSSIPWYRTREFTTDSIKPKLVITYTTATPPVVEPPIEPAQAGEKIFSLIGAFGF